ncbi:hypothetical protein HER10_EVM0000433 [Colletotrichum scovillei]|uniref:uncharacterized protein n=1 Tax=Colletotrichum scovillei TaxID=1209932 RepID=UPI0015C3041A|nr:uncharacterized protein HER10_EVM0000433 [Colletotrichum scovillei]KAF4775759.1 hypothetical protein HER10_EVM0000433 [Colletotrichum scovillei]
MQLPTILLFAATAAALALPEPSTSGGPLPAAFKNQWNCPAGSSSPPATYIQMTQNGAAEGGVTVFCTI